MLYCLSLLSCLLGSFFIEAMSKPKPLAIRFRSKVGVLIHSLLIILGYSLIVLVTQRLFFSVGLCLVLVIIITVVNNAKYATLREPLAFSDFFLYLQAIQHPRLYLPFLGVLPLILLVSGVLVLFLLGIFLESSDFNWFSLSALFLLVSAILAFYLISKLSLKTVISEELMNDCKSFGVLATLCIYAFNAVSSKTAVQNRLVGLSPLSSSQVSLSTVETMQDLVVVQSESFFDARRLSSNIREEILSQYDQCLNLSDHHGVLDVPAWGANTMRTEFAFLTSLTSDQIGLAQYYPYRQLLGLKVPSIVSHLKLLGYHCVCVHPHAASFFMRDKFFKQLGFDEFVDDKQFVGAVREGPYVADSAVTEKIQEVLSRVDKPCFIFAITMENHGPLHLETLEDEEWVDYYNQQPKDGLDDLTVYLRHLKNADKMISQLCDIFSKRERKTVFSFYGDHVPAMSKVFKQLEYKDPRSNYFIWSGISDDRGESEELKVEDLAQYLVRLLGNIR